MVVNIIYLQFTQLSVVPVIDKHPNEVKKKRLDFIFE